MTPEEKSLLERTYKLAEDNNAILRSIRRSNRLSTSFRILYWAVIILSGFAAYYYVQPYMTMAIDLYNKAQTGLVSVQNQVNGVQNTVNSVKGLLK
ncbi:MAG: hypothetical protein WCP09_03245 [Candidatus Taylorbacteria bacterium]